MYELRPLVKLITSLLDGRGGSGSSSSTSSTSRGRRRLLGGTHHIEHERKHNVPIFHQEALGGGVTAICGSGGGISRSVALVTNI